MAGATLKKPCLEPVFGGDDSSILSQVTNKALTINKLTPFKNIPRTKPVKVAVKAMNYKKAKIYDAGGDIKAQWFVYYSILENGAFKRYKLFKDINTAKTKDERMELALYYRESINKWLINGGLEEKNVSQNIIACIDNFIAFKQASKIRPNTKDKYRIQLGIFKNWLIEQKYDALIIGEVKKQILFQYLQYVKKRSGVNTGKTINDYLTNLSTFFNHYIDNYDDYLERNPAKKISREPVHKGGNTAFTDDEFEAIKKYLLVHDPYLWFVCEVVYYTGLRNEAEALEIRLRDFDLKRNVLWVDAWVAKNKIRQSVPIYPEFKELLLSLDIWDLPKDWYLFGRGDKPGPVGRGLDVFPARFRKVKEHLGLGRQHGMYCFKSSRACHLYDDGAEIREIQLLFRHQTPLITMEYLKSLGRVERDRILDKGRRI